MMRAAMRAALCYVARDARDDDDMRDDASTPMMPADDAHLRCHSLIFFTLRLHDYLPRAMIIITAA